MNKALILKNINEYNYFIKNKNNFKLHIKIVFFPINLNRLFMKKNKIHFYYEYGKKKNRINTDIFFYKKLNTNLKLIDNILNKIYYKKNKIYLFGNSAHRIRNYFDIVFNYINYFENIIKIHKIKKITFFEINNQNPKTIINNLIISDYLKEKIILEKINIGDNLENNNEDFPLFNFYPIEKKTNLIKPIYEYLKNLFQQKNLTLLSLNLPGSFKSKLYSKISKNYNIINYENIFFKKKKINYNKIIEEVFFELKKNRKFIKFYYFKFNINFFDLFEIYFKQIAAEIIEYGIYHIKKIDYVYKKFKPKYAISGYEVISNNIAHDYLVSKKIKYLTITHGGTIGHYINRPVVPFYVLNKTKYSHYLTTSKEIKNYLLNNLKKLNEKFYKKNIIYSYPFDKIFNLKKNAQNKNVKIAYFCGPANAAYSSKLGLQDNLYRKFIRLNILKIVSQSNKIQMGIRFYYEKVKKNFTFSSYEKFKNINDLDNKNINFIFSNYDLIICESPSTTIIEAQYSNKPIVVFNDPSSVFNKKTSNYLKKRLEILNNYNQITSFFKSISKQGFNHKIFKNKYMNDKSFLKKYYSYEENNKDLYNKIYKDLKENFFNKND